MKALRWFSIFAGLSLISFFMAADHAQLANEYKPEVGQDGKDIVWVPTPDALVNRMLDLAKLTPNDVVIDLAACRT